MATKGGSMDAMFHLIFILYGRIIITTLFPLMKKNLVILADKRQKTIPLYTSVTLGIIFL